MSLLKCHHPSLLPRQDVAKLTKQLNMTLAKAAKEMWQMPNPVKKKEHDKYSGIMDELFKTFGKVLRSSTPRTNGGGGGNKKPMAKQPTP